MKKFCISMRACSKCNFVWKGEDFNVNIGLKLHQDSTIRNSCGFSQ